MVQWEKDKIKGAVRTDFILSAEIIVISLGAVAAKAFSVQIGVLIGVSLIMTVGVYGLVAGIVKLDDVGVFLSQRSASIQQALGRFLLWGAPKLMKFLSIAGTTAMFLVGGHILVEGIPALHHFSESIQAMSMGWSLMVFDLLVGVIAGTVVLATVHLVQKLRGKTTHFNAYKRPK